MSLYFSGLRTTARTGFPSCASRFTHSNPVGPPAPTTASMANVCILQQYGHVSAAVPAVCLSQASVARPGCCPRVPPCTGDRNLFFLLLAPISKFAAL